jgi:AraC-like DNA-binding protein
MTETMTAQELRTVRHRAARKSVGGPQGPAGREVKEVLIDQLPRALQRVREYVETNLESSLSLQDLATVAGLSTSHFIRVSGNRRG